MKVFMIEYTTDFGATTQTMLVNAETSTKAYMEAFVILPKEADITGLFEVI